MEEMEEEELAVLFVRPNFDIDNPYNPYTSWMTSTPGTAQKCTTMTTAMR